MAAQRRASRIREVLFQNNIQAGYFTGLSIGINYSSTAFLGRYFPVDRPMEGKGEMWACWGIRQKGGMFKGSAKLQINELKPLEVSPLLFMEIRSLLSKREQKGLRCKFFLTKLVSWRGKKREVTSRGKAGYMDFRLCDFGRCESLGKKRGEKSFSLVAMQ